MKGIQQCTLAEYLKAPGISQSRLKAMGKSPAHFKCAEDEEAAPTRDQIIGHIFHTAVLEPDLLEKSYYLRPDTYEGVGGEQKKWSGNANICKEWIKLHSDREILLSSEHADIIAMRKSVMEHPAAHLALSEGLSEQCLFATDPETEIGLKCRCDRLSGNAIVDLKTTDDASPEGFARSTAKFGYDVQAAFYLDMANILDLNKRYFIFIAVEKSAPYAVAVYELDEESISVGRRKYRRWLSMLSHCFCYDEWPAYSPDIVPLRLPQWSIVQEERLLLT